jgi:hypothetical protein
MQYFQKINLNMKTIQYFFFVAIATVLMAADCSNKDSEFYNDVFISVPDLVKIETKPAYVVNDILWLNSDSFSRYLTEVNQSRPLDVFKTTTGAVSFSFTYVLEKRSGDTWNVVPLGANLIHDKGNAAETDSFIAAYCIYNDAGKTYDFRYGAKLVQAGDYRVSFGYNSINTTDVELRSDSTDHNLFLNINSANPKLDGGGYYNFTVN